MALMTQRAYAAKRGVTPQYIGKLVSQGKIKKIGTRQIDARQADEAIKAFARAGAVAKSSRKAKPVKKASRAPKSRKRVDLPLYARSSVKAPRPSETRSLTAARAEREHYQALTAKLEYEKNVGRLLPAEDVLDALRKQNTVIRARFRGLGRKLAPALALCKTPAEAELVVCEAVDLELSELGRNPFSIATIAAALAVSPYEELAPTLPDEEAAPIVVPIEGVQQGLEVSL